MNNEQNLNISKSLDTAGQFIQNKKELKKIKKTRKTSNITRIFIYTSLLYLLQFMVMNNTISNFIFLTGATHLLNNSLFPGVVSVAATLSETLAKLLGGTFLNTIHNKIFNKTKKYNNEKELVEDLVDKEIEFDINTYTIIMYDDVLELLRKNNLVNDFEDLARYKTLKLEDDNLKEKYEELKNLLIKRRIIGDYIQSFSCRNNVEKDKEYDKLKYARWMFWISKCLTCSKFLGMIGLESNLFLSIIEFIVLLFGSDKAIYYKNYIMMEVLNEKKLSIDGFDMPQDIEILKCKYDKINQKLDAKGREIVELYYNYCAKQIVIEDSVSEVLTQKEEKKSNSIGIAPIDRSLETEPVVVKSRILRREDNV